MSQINLSNWEIVDDVQNTRLVIRSQATGEQLEFTESGIFTASTGIDADTLDGVDAADIGTNVSDDGSTVTSSSTDLNFTTNITASGDGDGTSTIVVDDAFVLNTGDTMSGDLDMGATNTVTNLEAPSNGTDAATKAFVESVAQGLNLKQEVDAATSGGNVDLSSPADPNPIDGISLSDGDRVLLKDQTDSTENGIYDAVTATDPATWARSSDMDEDSDVTSGAFTFVDRGDTNGNRSFVITTNDPIALGLTSITWAVFTTAGELTAGAALIKSGQTFAFAAQDDEEVPFGTNADVTERYDAANDDLRFQDSTNTADRMALDRTTGDLSIGGSLSEGSAL